MKKCFWLGHNPNKWNKNTKEWNCSYCGTSNYDKETIGHIILIGLMYVGYFLAFLLGIALLGLILYSVLGFPVQYLSCKAFAEQNKLEFTFNFWKGCMVHYNNFWISPDNFIQLIK